MDAVAQEREAVGMDSAATEMVERWLIMMMIYLMMLVTMLMMVERWSIMPIVIMSIKMMVGNGHGLCITMITMLLMILKQCFL